MVQTLDPEPTNRSQVDSSSASRAPQSWGEVRMEQMSDADR